MRQLQGKNVLVTGGSRGLGAYIARAFAAKGANVAVVAGESSPALVAASVIKAVVGDRAEIIVSPGPIRSLLAINQFFPDFMGYMARKVGVTGVFQAVVEAEKRAARQLPAPSAETQAGPAP
jgi:NAD(P)-dependent dehydrogenase (short-subunit alcohol dehydrogenase family)